MILFHSWDFVNTANWLIIIVIENVIVASEKVLPRGGRMKQSNIREYVKVVAFTKALKVSVAWLLEGADAPIIQQYDKGDILLE